MLVQWLARHEADQLGVGAVGVRKVAPQAVEILAAHGALRILAGAVRLIAVTGVLSRKQICQLNTARKIHCCLLNLLTASIFKVLQCRLMLV